MTLKTLLIPIAYDNLITQNFIDPHLAISQTDYYCPGCYGKVRLRDGAKKIKHFYHLNEDKKCSLESIKHKLYKKAIVETKRFLTPCNTLLIFDKVEEEKNIFDYRPDIIGYIDDKQYIIEVVNTSDITYEKLLKIKKSKTVCFSIDTVYENYNVILRHITEFTAYKKPIYTNQIKELDKLKIQYQQEIKYLQDIKIPAIEKNDELIKLKVKEIIERNFVMEFTKVCTNGWHLYRNQYREDLVMFQNPETKRITLKINKLDL